MSDSTIKILVVEDEMIIGAKISLFLTELGYEVAALLPRAEEALLHVKDSPPDIALLDINLKGSMDGIELANTLHQDHRIPVIFLTANSDDATFQRARTAKPYAFLAKPFKKTDLQRALELTISLLAENAHKEEQAPLPSDENEGTDAAHVLSDRIFVHDKGRMVKILFSQILYVEAERNYCRIVTTDHSHLLSMPMKSLENKLPATFQRIHRSFIANLTHLEELDEHGIVVGKKPLPLSKQYREELMGRIRTA